MHFSSVLAYHRASGTIHSDDTIMYVQLPRVLGLFGIDDAFTFHPTLSQALEQRAGAADAFRRWASALASHWGDAKSLCAAHTAVLTTAGDRQPTMGKRLAKALDAVEPTLSRHEKRYG